MFKKLFSSQLRINMLSGVAATAVNVIVVAVAYPVYLHFLGYEKYGVWLVLTTVLTFARLGNLGIGPAITKLVAEEYCRENIEGIQKYVTTALALLCSSGTIVLIVILIFKSQIISLFKLSDENAKIALWLLPYVGVLSIYVFAVQALNAVLSGLGRMDLENYLQSCGRVMTVVIGVGLMYSGFGVESMLIAIASSYIVIQFASIVCIRHIVNIRFLRLANLDVQRAKRILSFCGRVVGGSLISMFLDPFNKLMISRYAGVSMVPVYDIAFTGSMQIKGLVEAGIQALMPEVSRIGANMTIYAKDRILRIYTRVMKIIFLFCLPMYGILAVFLPLILHVWLGNKFVEPLPAVFRIMLIGSFLSLLGVPAYYTLMGMGHVRLNLRAHVIQAVINVVIILSVFFTLTLSIGAIVWSSSVAMGAATLYLTFQKRRTFQKVSEQLSRNETSEEIIEEVSAAEANYVEA
jgi:O-antigen/teichoic acid export membrane protein